MLIRKSSLAHRKSKKNKPGNCLVVQVTGSIPDRGTKIPHAAQLGRKKKSKPKKKHLTTKTAKIN